MKIPAFAYGAAGVVATAVVMAHPAIYRDGVLHIPSGVVVEPGGDVTFYGDIEMRSTADGNFSLVQADPRQMVAEIDSVNVAVGPAANEADIVVSGFLSSLCHELEEPAVIDLDGNVIFVALAEKQAIPEDECDAPVPNFQTFTQALELDVSDREPGDYTILVNGDVETTFSLDQNLNFL